MHLYHQVILHLIFRVVYQSKGPRYIEQIYHEMQWTCTSSKPPKGSLHELLAAGPLKSILTV